MRLLSGLIAGALFGAGLALSGMVDPARVLGFLDIAGIAQGTWDPTLAFVMAGALAVATPGYWLARRRARPGPTASAHGAIKAPARGRKSIKVWRPLLAAPASTPVTVAPRDASKNGRSRA